MATATPVGRMQEIAERASVTLDELLEFLDSPSGRRMRKILATTLIISVPFVMRIPGLRRSPIGRIIELVGGTALVVKLAEAIRDWERDQTRTRSRRTVIDVPLTD
jgi:hypothetical protein